MAWLGDWIEPLRAADEHVALALREHRDDALAAITRLDECGVVSAVREAVDGPLAGLLRQAEREPELLGNRCKDLLIHFVTSDALGPPHRRLARLLRVCFYYDALEPHKEWVRAQVEKIDGGWLSQSGTERALRATWRSAFLYADGFDERRGTAAKWLGAIARRETIRRIQRARRERDALIDMYHGALRALPATPLDEAIRAEERQLLDAILNTAQGNARELLDGLAEKARYGSLAAQMHTTPTAIAKRARRLRDWLDVQLRTAGLEV